ncbi:MAG: ImmA/IrrE family metallo-endopeptidase [Acidimicrobiia bacterium]|nr:ImmA/IrrE family metallo-endopeptidase [Gammaproteobacteria bacterium]MYI21089.1 ImmA/IrrE family metallo-endopeptidase [Acidimicrobiia bacterium]
MNRKDGYLVATHIGEKTVRKYGIDKLPVDPIALAKRLGIEVQPKPASAEGVSGMLLRVGDQFGITYATHIQNIGFQHFSVAHELGHYFLPGHIEAVLGSTDVHQSHAGFASGNRYEMEADHFAAGLLMPTFLFAKAMQSAGNGLTSIDSLADLCQTSRTATSMRYAQITQDPVAIVLSIGDRVDYCFMSDTLREVDSLEWIRKGSPLPKNSATFEFNQDQSRVLAGERYEDTSDIRDWFNGPHNFDMTEEVVGLGRYGKSLTVLTAVDLPDPEEFEEENEMIESWQPKFR